MEGRHVHPSTLYPGGVGTVPTRAALHRLPRPADEVRRVHEEGRAAARRPVRLLLRGAARLRGGRPAPRPARLLGLVQRPRGLRLHLQEHDRVGPRRCTSRPASSWTASWSPPTWSTSTWASASCSAARSTTTGQDGETFVKTDPLGNPVDQRHPVEPDDDPAAAEARLRRQVHLGHVAALVRQADRRSPGARHRRRPDRPALGDGAGRAGRHRLRQGDRPQREDLPAEDGDAARGRVRVEDPEVEQRHRARPRPDLLPGLRRGRARSTSSSRRWRSCTPAGPRPGPSSRCPTRRSAAASTRRCAACCRTTS